MSSSEDFSRLLDGALAHGLGRHRVVLARGGPADPFILHNARTGSRCAAASLSKRLVETSMIDFVRDTLYPRTGSSASYWTCSTCSWTHVDILGTDEVALTLEVDVAAQCERVRTELDDLVRSGTLTEVAATWSTSSRFLLLFSDLRAPAASARVLLLERLRTDLADDLSEFVAREAAVELLGGTNGFAGFHAPGVAATLPALKDALVAELLTDQAYVLAHIHSTYHKYYSNDVLVVAAQASVVPGASFVALTRTHFELMRRRALLDLDLDNIVVLPAAPSPAVLEALAALYDPKGADSVSTLAGALEVASAL